MTQWYYSDYQRNRLGPVAARDLAELHDAGQLQGDTLVWREGLAQWQPWREMMHEVLVAIAGTPAPPAVEAMPLSAGVNPYAMAEPVRPAAAEVASLSSGVNPYAMAEPQSPYAPPRAALSNGSDYVAGGEVVYAGFWKRFAAYVIDSFVVGIATWVVQMVVMAGLFGMSMGAAVGGDPSSLMAGAGVFGFVVGLVLLPLALNAVYYAYMHSSSRQATLGKMAVGIKVTNDSGHAITFWRGIGRFFAMIISMITFYIGFIMAGFTERKRALHDMIASTLVVDQWAFTAHPERQRHELGTVTVVILVIAGVLVIGYVLLILALIGLGLAAGGGQ